MSRPLLPVIFATLLAALGGPPAYAQPVPLSIAERDAGRAAFAPCASCHALGPASRSGFGPALGSVLGRRAGSLGDYAYTPAMRRAGIIWSERTLAAFVKNPQAVVPGTRMRFFAIGYDERRLAALTRYLRGMAAPAPASSAPLP